MAGGTTDESRKEYSKDILIYNGNKDEWTKVGDLCSGRHLHAMSLVPAVVEDECIVDIDCFADE